jgi:hypothetical protein
VGSLPSGRAHVPGVVGWWGRCRAGAPTCRAWWGGGVAAERAHPHVILAGTPTCQAWWGRCRTGAPTCHPGGHAHVPGVVGSLPIILASLSWRARPHIILEGAPTCHPGGHAHVPGVVGSLPIILAGVVAVRKHHYPLRSVAAALPRGGALPRYGDRAAAAASPPAPPQAAASGASAAGRRARSSLLRPCARAATPGAGLRHRSFVANAPAPSADSGLRPLARWGYTPSSRYARVLPRLRRGARRKRRP